MYNYVTPIFMIWKQSEAIKMFIHKWTCAFWETQLGKGLQSSQSKTPFTTRLASGTSAQLVAGFQRPTNCKWLRVYQQITPTPEEDI